MSTPGKAADRMTLPLSAVDPEIAEIVRLEARRQSTGIELIPSENFVSEAVLEAAGSVLTNKYAEGYPGKRYYGGCEFVDRAEQLAIDRAKQLFGAEHANVQPHSGSQANTAVYMSALQPGDTVLGMNLAHGGHLTHGHPLNFSGRMYKFIPYGVTRETETIDYDEVEKLAREHKPKMIVAGASAYSRIIDFPLLARIAHENGALLFVDMAHIAGLVAAGVHPSPVPHADFVSTTTHKTLRGPRGGLVLCREKYAKELDKLTFPGIQGGPADAHHRGEGGVPEGSDAARVHHLSEAGSDQRKGARCRNGQARIPHRERRHGQSPLSRGHSLARADRQSRATGARSRGDHREQKCDSLRPDAADDGRRNPHGHARHYHARDGANPKWIASRVGWPKFSNTWATPPWNPKFGPKWKPSLRISLSIRAAGKNRAHPRIHPARHTRPPENLRRCASPWTSAARAISESARTCETSSNSWRGKTTARNISLIGSRRHFDEFGPLPENFTLLPYDAEPGSFRTHVHLPIVLENHRIDLLHMPWFYAPAMVPCRLVITMHDLTEIAAPSVGTSPVVRSGRLWFARRALDRADRILAVSQSAKRELERVFGVPGAKIEVIYNAVDERFFSEPLPSDADRILERHAVSGPLHPVCGQCAGRRKIWRA